MPSRFVLTLAALAVAALVVLPQFASAGPIRWDYLASIQPDGVRTLRIGIVPGPGGGVEVAAQLRGENLEGPGSGSQRIRIGAMLDIDVDTIGSGESPPPAQFDSGLIIRDRASGESGQVNVIGRGRYLGDDLLLDRKVALELLSERSHALTLGGNRYEIEYSTSQGDDDRISYLWADVTVSPAVATPEPGTLALAALGIGALGLARRLRRGT